MTPATIPQLAAPHDLGSDLMVSFTIFFTSSRVSFTFSVVLASSSEEFSMLDPESPPISDCCVFLKSFSSIVSICNEGNMKSRVDLKWFLCSICRLLWIALDDSFGENDETHQFGYLDVYTKMENQKKRIVVNEVGVFCKTLDRIICSSCSRYKGKKYEPRQLR